VERGSAVVTNRVRIRAGGQQRLDDLYAAVLAGLVQRSGAIAVGTVDDRSLFNSSREPPDGAD
jgi:hypothetical protein